MLIPKNTRAIEVVDFEENFSPFCPIFSKTKKPPVGRIARVCWKYFCKVLPDSDRSATLLLQLSAARSLARRGACTFLERVRPERVSSVRSNRRSLRSRTLKQTPKFCWLLTFRAVCVSAVLQPNSPAKLQLCLIIGDSPVCCRRCCPRSRKPEKRVLRSS